jgi:hypothetical protein
MVSALPFLLLLVFYPALPESPRYLMVKGDKQGAWKVLEQVARVNGAVLPSGSLIPSQSSQRVPNSVGNKLALLIIFCSLSSDM